MRLCCRRLRANPAVWGETPPERTPLWAIGSSALLLIAFGFARQRDRETSDARGDPRQEETGRGRPAETPSEIPAMGWKDIFLRVNCGISENRILLAAAGVTFYALSRFSPGSLL
jgi:hypothetical protein